MLTLKILVAIAGPISLILSLIMNHWWKDKRTKRYRYLRNGFMVFAVLACVLTAVNQVVGEMRQREVAEMERSQRLAFENETLGGASPDLWVLLYDDGKLVCPQTNMIPADKDGMQLSALIGVRGESNEPTICVLVNNSNAFPIYDISITLQSETPNQDNSHSFSHAFKRPEKIPVLYPNTSSMILCPVPRGLMSKVVTFNVQTKRANSLHEIGIALISNKWEYVSTTTDFTHHKLLGFQISDHFPRNKNGDPSVPIYTHTIVSNSTSLPTGEVGTH